MKGFSLSQIIRHIGEIIQQPELHMREIPVLVGLGILIIFIILVLLALLLIRPSKKYAEEVSPEKLQRQIKRRYIFGLISAMLAISSLGIASMHDSRPSFCADCHQMASASKSLTKSVHKDIDCLACHQEPGVSGVFIQKMELMEMAAQRTNVIGKTMSAKVSNEACLRCHDNVLYGPKTLGTIRMDHRQPMKAGYKCSNCHYSQPLFHAKTARLDTFGMGRCINCHNQKTASADCNICHMREIVGAKHIDHAQYPKTDISNSIACRSCHSMTMCVNCHNIKLPHPEAWKSGDHALLGFVGKKLCLECHKQSVCLKCHAGTLPHGDNWVKRHGPASKNSKEPCSRCHKQEQFCIQCHIDTKNFKLIYAAHSEKQR